MLSVFVSKQVKNNKKDVTITTTRNVRRMMMIRRMRRTHGLIHPIPQMMDQ